LIRVKTLHLPPRASAEKFPGEANEKEDKKIAKKTKNTTIKPLSGGRGGNGKKDRKIAKKTEK